MPLSVGMGWYAVIANHYNDLCTILAKYVQMEANHEKNQKVLEYGKFCITISLGITSPCHEEQQQKMRGDCSR